MKEAVQVINDIIWSLALVVLLVGAGLYFSVGTRFVQVRRFGLLVKNLFPKRNRERGKVGISSFEAFCIALSGRVGTGNIVGVATAIAFGGILGSTIMMGVKRGLFSNEAGEGTGAIPSASVNVKHPAQQGLAQAFSVYVDTLLVCTATALMIITTGSFNVIDQDTGKILVENMPSLGNNCSAFTQQAIYSSMGEVGSIFIGIAMVFFVFTTVFAYYFYAESNISFLCGNNPKWNKRAVGVFQILFFGAIIFGATHDASLVWTLADIGIGSMAWINVVSILILSPIAFRFLREYENLHP